MVHLSADAQGVGSKTQMGVVQLQGSATGSLLWPWKATPSSLSLLLYALVEGFISHRGVSRRFLKEWPK